MLEVLTAFVNIALSGGLPEDVRPYLCGGRLVPLIKKDGGLRPLVVGEFLRSLVAKLAAHQMSEAASALLPLQVGVAGKGPYMQAATLAVRSWAATMPEDHLILKIDVKNAYNSIHRHSCLEQVRKLCPEVLGWARWSHAGNSWLYLGRHIIECKTGVQQGDPLAPLLFSLGLHPAIEAIADTPELRQLWYLDDGVLYGRASVVAAAFVKLRAALFKIGLVPNLSKCEIYQCGSSPPTGGLAGIEVVSDKDKWSYLGVPSLSRPPTLSRVCSAASRL